MVIGTIEGGEIVSSEDTLLVSPDRNNSGLKVVVALCLNNNGLVVVVNV